VTLAAHEAYELWADTYPPVAHNPLMRLEQEVVEPVLAHIRATRALDVGTGSGRYLPVLESTGAAVLGIDFSLAMLRRGSTALTRVCADARQLPFRRSSFDLINASLMVGDIPDLASWTREMSRVLAARGHLVYSDFHPSWAQQGWSLGTLSSVHINVEVGGGMGSIQFPVANVTTATNWLGLSAELSTPTASIALPIRISAT